MVEGNVAILSRRERVIKVVITWKSFMKLQGLYWKRSRINDKENIRKSVTEEKGQCHLHRFRLGDSGMNTFFILRYRPLMLESEIASPAHRL